MMTFTYYPGCSLKGTAKDYAESIEAVCSVLGIQLEELEDWNCCGATAAHSLNRRTAINLAGRNLRLAEEVGRDMLVPCPLCYNRLKTARFELLGKRKQEYDVAIQGDQLTIWDLANFFAQDSILHQVDKFKKQDLSGLNIVCYYGCMASRPPKITGETYYENPMSMDNILRRLGANVIQWSYKTDCCGASHLVARPDLVFKLVGKLFQKAVQAGADCIAVSCQMCHANLDLHQRKIIKEAGLDRTIPVIYFTELIGLAMGHGDVTKWFGRHFIDPTGLLEQKCGISF